MVIPRISQLVHESLLLRGLLDAVLLLGMLPLSAHSPLVGMSVSQVFLGDLVNTLLTSFLHSIHTSKQPSPGDGVQGTQRKGSDMRRRQCWYQIGEEWE